MPRRLVIPGEQIAEGKYKLGGGVFKEGEKIYSSVMGLLDEGDNFLRVIPMVGKYMPKVGDFIIGIIESSQRGFWDVDINSAYSANLNAYDYYRDIDPQSELFRILAPGDVVHVYLREITPTRRVYVTMTERGARTLKGGRLLKISPTKIPRVIGKKNSMVAMIMRECNCNILVGQNGRIWLDGKPRDTNLAVRAIEQIEKEAHTSGLTDRIKEMITREREAV